MHNNKCFVSFLIIMGVIIFFSMSMTAFAVPIYHAPKVTTDISDNIWVCFGTGDKTDPQGTGTTKTGAIYCIKDNDLTATYALTNLTNATSTPSTDSPTNHGWYISLAGAGEKVIGAAEIIDRNLRLTTYIPPTATSACCGAEGESYEYTLCVYTGEGGNNGGYCTGTPNGTGTRTRDVGAGIPSGVVVSKNPDTGKYDIYISTSVGTSGGSNVKQWDDLTQTNTRSKTMIFWRDTRITN
jgi:Tfp pilus tip-associated adhesin PilY1